MARKNNEQILKKIAPKPNIAANISMYSEVYKKQIKDSPVIGSSPTKKIRTISKKKWYFINVLSYLTNILIKNTLLIKNTYE